eukprot:17421-Heterococcus_DN1.PRE.1
MALHGYTVAQDTQLCSSSEISIQTPIASLYVPAGQSLHNSILYNPNASLQQRKQIITAIYRYT